VHIVQLLDGMEERVAEDIPLGAIDLAPEHK